MSKTKRQREKEQLDDVATINTDMVEGVKCLTKEEVAAAIHNLIVAEYNSRPRLKKALTGMVFDAAFDERTQLHEPKKRGYKNGGSNGE